MSLKIAERALFHKNPVEANITLCPFSNIHSDFITSSIQQRASPFLIIPSDTLFGITKHLISFDSPKVAFDRSFDKDQIFRTVYKLLKHISFDSKSDQIAFLCSPINCTKKISMLSNFYFEADHWGVVIFPLQSFEMNFAEGLNYSLDSARVCSIVLSILGAHILECYERGMLLMDISLLSKAAPFVNRAVFFTNGKIK